MSDDAEAEYFQTTTMVFTEQEISPDGGSQSSQQGELAKIFDDREILATPPPRYGPVFIDQGL